VCPTRIQPFPTSKSGIEISKNACSVEVTCMLEVVSDGKYFVDGMLILDDTVKYVDLFGTV
jgi:hypothetical protein